ncbi:MAG: S-adenosylmethionine:tRNA ribosyltransferase-isomerase, partial [Planctomycetota bacterium]
MNGAVLVSEFDFVLPPHLLATRPVEPRDQARLLVHDRGTRATTHARVADLGTFLRAGDLLVLNDTRVQPWRLRGRRTSGGAVECLLVRLDGDAGEALVKPSKRLRPGEALAMEDGALTLQLRATMGEGRWSVALQASQGTVAEALERCGRAPLPPYIVRDGSEDVAADRARYQT